MKRIAIFIFFSTALLAKISAQNIELQENKYFSNPLNLNPALTGLQNTVKLLTNLGYNTNVGIETKLPFKNFIGINFQKERVNFSNPISKSNLSINYAKQKKLKKDINFKYGIKASMIHKSIKSIFENNQPIVLSDFYGLSYDSLLHLSPIQYFDFALGTSIMNKNLLLGASISHISQPQVSLDKNNKYNLPFEINSQFLYFKEFKNLTLFPNIILAYQKKQYVINSGISLSISNFTCGANYILSKQISGDFTNSYFLNKKLLNISCSYTYKKSFFAIQYKNDITNYNSFWNGIINLTYNKTLIKNIIKVEKSVKQLRKMY